MFIAFQAIEGLNFQLFFLYRYKNGTSSETWNDFLLACGTDDFFCEMWSEPPTPPHHPLRSVTMSCRGVIFWEFKFQRGYIFVHIFLQGVQISILSINHATLLHAVGPNLDFGETCAEHSRLMACQTDATVTWNGVASTCCICLGKRG